MSRNSASSKASLPQPRVEERVSLRGDTHSPWPHRIAIVLVIATFPLIWIGGLVTTYKAGMAVYDWPNTFGYNMLLYPIAKWLRGSFDLFIEHGHRLFATFVGCLTIALVVTVYRSESRTWVKRFSVGMLLLVILQGVLGGMRVLLDRQTLALIHGCTANIFFATTVAMAVFTSRLWREPASGLQTSPKLARLCWTTTAIAYTQIVIGAHVRHVTHSMSGSVFKAAVFFHLIVAGLLALSILYQGGHIMLNHFGVRKLRTPSMFLSLFVLIQVALGGASWVLKYSWPQFMSQFQFAAEHTITAQSFLQGVVVTAHVATGSLILVFSLTLSLRTSRLMQTAPTTNEGTDSIEDLAGAIA